MDDNQKIQIMSDTASSIVSLLQKRMKARVETLNTLSSANTVLDGLPEAVKIKREEECAKIRAVIQEQTDLIDIINTLYPIPASLPKSAKKERPVRVKKQKKNVSDQ